MTEEEEGDDVIRYKGWKYTKPCFQKNEGLWGRLEEEEEEKGALSSLAQPSASIMLIPGATQGKGTRCPCGEGEIHFRKSLCLRAWTCPRAHTHCGL